MSNCTIIMYHFVRYIEDSRYPQIKGLDIRHFKQQIEFLKNNFSMISTEQLLQAASDRTYKLPENAALLTFDDGYIDHFTNVYPVLKEHKIYGFFSMPARILAERKLLDVNKIHFILASADIDTLVSDLFSRLDFYRQDGRWDYPDNDELLETSGKARRFDNAKVTFIKSILQYHLPLELRNRIVDELFQEYIPITESAFAKELYMSYDQIKLLKNEGMHIGLHGYDHFWLGEMKTDEMQNDIMKSMDFFSGFIDKNNWVMCYPYGSHNPGMVKFIKDRGCRLGFTTEVKIAHLNERNPLLLPRLDTNDFPPKSENYQSRG